MPEDTPQISPETRLLRSKEILFSEIDQDKVMIDIQHGTYFGLNPVAGEIWDLLETPHTLSELVDHLLKAYEVDAATCQAETKSVLEHLLKFGLVEIVA
jgi:Coenzyme PQQ synthesis protein D (PqqD)